MCLVEGDGTVNHLMKSRFVEVFIEQRVQLMGSPTAGACYCLSTSCGMHMICTCLYHTYADPIIEIFWV